MSALHPDFAGLRVEAGELKVTAHADRFDLVNLVAFGGAADRPTHVPVELGRIGAPGAGGVALWESTGAHDRLPFWNTNVDGDAWLYLVHGSVRVEFKETFGDVHFGHLQARTGDLFRLPADIAHRTFSGDGKRRITLEVMPDNPFWAGIGSRPVRPDHGGRVGGFSFAVTSDGLAVQWPGGRLLSPRDTAGRALRALVAYELHLGINELDGGLLVHDLGEEVVLRVPGGHAETLPGRDVLAVFAGLLAELAP
jgi:hypothetical protein